MKRNAMEELKKWQADSERKPMVLRGARQVGKTWLMKEFGQNCYDNFVYFNFDEEDELKSIFETNKNPARIIELLSMISGSKIQPGNTLIVFDVLAFFARHSKTAEVCFISAKHVCVRSVSSVVSHVNVLFCVLFTKAPDDGAKFSAFIPTLSSEYSHSRNGLYDDFAP